MNFAGVRCSEAHAPIVVAQPLAAQAAQIIYAGEAGLPAYEEIRRLNRIRVGGASAKFLQHNLPALVASCDLTRALFRHVRVEERVRETDEIGREAVAAYVRRLPDKA